MRFIKVDRCCRCGFNEHGQHWKEIINSKGKKVMVPSYPLIYCMYNYGEDFRDNMRAVTHGVKNQGNSRIICIIGDPEYEGEYEKQLEGFPDWCPLEFCD